MIQRDPDTSKGNHIDQNGQAHTFCITETEHNHAVESGQAYNINTGWITVNGTTNSSVVYIKSDEQPLHDISDLVIQSVIIAVGTISGTPVDMPYATIIRNPTAGTIVDDATAIPISSNSTFGDNSSLDSIMYKGADTKTLTDGTDHGIVMLKGESRTPVPELNIDLKKGSSIGIKINPNTTAGGCQVYVAFVVHRKDGNNQ